MQRRKSDTILYIASGSYEAPATGLDNVIKTHIAELSRGAYDVIAVIVSPTIRHYSFFETGRCRIHVYPNLFHNGAGKLRILYEKLRLAFLSPNSIQCVSLYSPAASLHIRELLTGYRESVVIIDYIYSLANIAPRILFGSAHKVMYISHDVITKEAFRSRLHCGGASLHTLLVLMQLAKSRWYADVAIKRADVALFLSEHERTLRAAIARKSISLLPFSPLDGDGTDNFAPAGHNNTVLFIGSPDFEPNAFAIAWIVKQLSPCLMGLDPHLRIMLVGKECGKYIPAQAANVVAAGFVAGEALNDMLRSAVALVCPVVHGGGVKIKILDAIAQHCPVIATAEALRGYEYFGITPHVHMGDPEHTAKAVVELATRLDVRMKMKDGLAQSLQRYQRYRKGKLLEIADALMQENAA